MPRKPSLAFFHTLLFTFALLGIIAVRADDGPKVLKRGGLPYEDLWKEADVKTYLNLPQLASMDGIIGLSMDEISKRVEAVQGVAGYKLVKDNSFSFTLSSNELPVITFELRAEQLPGFHVSIYDFRSWNDVCGKLYKYITTTIELWNKIPDYYAVERGDAAYTLTRKGRKPQKWHFASKKLYIIAVESRAAQEDAKSEENAFAEINDVIRKLVAVIDDKTQ